MIDHGPAHLAPRQDHERPFSPAGQAPGVFSLQFLPMLSGLMGGGGMDMKGGSSEATSTTTAGSQDAGAGGGFRSGTFLNNVAMKGTVDSAAAAGDPSQADQASNWIMIGCAAAALAALWYAFKHR